MVCVCVDLGRRQWLWKTRWRPRLARNKLALLTSSSSSNTHIVRLMKTNLLNSLTSLLFPALLMRFLLINNPFHKLISFQWLSSWNHDYPWLADWNQDFLDPVTGIIVTRSFNYWHRDSSWPSYWNHNYLMVSLLKVPVPSYYLLDDVLDLDNGSLFIHVCVWLKGRLFFIFSYDLNI